MPPKLTDENFFARCAEIHNYKYDYTKSIFINLRSKIEVWCPDCNKFFWQKALSHLQGHGCAICKKIKVNIGEFITRAIKIHGNRYKYISVKGKFATIKCSIHGLFTQNKFNHLLGRGCKLCAIDAQKLTLEEFILLSNNIHNYKYSYLKSKYVDYFTNIEIYCNDHGYFWQMPCHHIAGSRCPKCANITSKVEQGWLDSLNIPIHNRNVKIQINESKFFKVDGYCPETNTVYEFNGDFWHGNPKIYNLEDINKVIKKTFRELYNKTLEKERILKESGYQIISIWESEWNEIIK